MSLMHYTGELAALAVALFWTISAIAFEQAGNRMGSIAVNIIRMVMGLAFLTLFIVIRDGVVVASGASLSAWFWLSLSGLVGFFFGDLFLFKSYQLIGSRLAMLIMTLAPPIAALFGWVILSERLSFYNLLGMSLTFGGIALAIFGREGKGASLKLKFSPRGLVFAFFGALGQGGGLVLSKLGMGDYDAFAATQIRLISGLIAFILLGFWLRRWKSVGSGLKNRKGMIAVTTGSFFGPFLGVSFSLLAIQHTQTGIASTIMSMVPILIIAPAVLIYKQKVSQMELLGAVVSVSGVSLFFLL